MEKLFEAAAAGQAEAVAEVHRLLRGFARHVCRGGGPHGEAALDWEDVAQEAARRLLGVGLAQYAGAGSERSYMYSLVKTTVIQMSRAAARRQRREEDAVANGPVPVAADPGSHMEVRRILAALDPPCREIIRRALLQDEPYADLARELGLAESSVRARLSRCLQKARRLVDDRNAT
jgi:RNA polymerase sigma factor (sigma-70 family)